jgi:hypothetical protein
MAQHFLIQNIKTKKMQNVYKRISRQFQKGIICVISSLIYQELEDKNFKEDQNDRVFNTWRTVNGEREIFEIHYGLSENKITNIYLVK